MCLQRVTATLAGRAPHTANMAFVSRMLNGRSWNAWDFDGMCQPLAWYEGLDKPVTDDGYAWFWGLNFRTPGGMVRILIPRAGDLKRTDGSALDRPVTVYADAGVGESQVYQVIFAFTNALHEASVRHIREIAEAPVR